MAEWDTNIGIDFGIPIFEIAAYRVSPQRWSKENEKLRAQVRDLLGGGPSAEGTRESWTRRFERVVEYENKNVGGYAYGQAVGWLRLLHDGPSPLIKGYCYRLPQERLVRRFRQERFVHLGKQIELSFESEIDRRNHGAIVSALREAIVSTTRRGEVFAGRYLDLAAFDAVAPAIDWNSLMGRQ